MDNVTRSQDAFISVSPSATGNEVSFALPVGSSAGDPAGRPAGDSAEDPVSDVDS